MVEAVRLRVAAAERLLDLLRWATQPHAATDHSCKYRWVRAPATNFSILG